MGLHVVVPGLIKFISWNKFVQRIYVHVHKFLIERCLCTHICFHLKQKNTRKLKQFRDMETGGKTIFKTTLVFKILMFLRQWWILRDGWHTHTQPTQACFDAAVVAIPCA